MAKMVGFLHISVCVCESETDFVLLWWVILLFVVITIKDYEFARLELISELGFCVRLL